MKKVYVSWSDVHRQVQELVRQMWLDQWRPDYVVGITRGGLVPANLISQYLGCRMETLKVSLRDDSQGESNLWMAEDAFGHNMEHPKNILIVDDINDTGATLNYIREDWPSGCFPDNPRWTEVWGSNVRVAVLVDNESSKSEIPVSYSAVDINKAEQDSWIVFPWEEWWQR
jgi:hypoxanthine phosphoribosyltransferase